MGLIPLSRGRHGKEPLLRVFPAGNHGSAGDMACQLFSCIDLISLSGNALTENGNGKNHPRQDTILGEREGSSVSPCLYLFQLSAKRLLSNEISFDR